MSFGERLMSDPEGLARSLAVRHNLVRDNGVIVCWNCKRERALMPSLHCAACLTDAWQRNKITQPCCEQREQTEDDMRLMAPKQENGNGE